MRVPVAASVLAAALSVAAGATPVRAQDFSCTGALNAAERTICDSNSLRQLDERMARLYGWVWETTPRWKREALREDQRAFLAERNACEAGARCIRRAYMERIGFLTGRLAQGPRRSRFE